jgi:3-oxoacyl-[acyl-carrier protein] reductase
MNSLVNKNILITGASGDMGSFFADNFLKQNIQVTGIDIAEPRIKVEHEKYCFRKCNLSSFEDTQKVIDELVKERGAFDVVINTAGMIANAPVVNFVAGKMECHDPKLWETIIQSNLYTTFYTSTVAVKHMITNRKKGVIINISSISANGNPGQAAYSAAKAGINGMTVSLAKELGTFGIRAVAIAPGFFDTSTTRANVNVARIKALTNSTPLKRLGNLFELQKTLEYIIDTEFINGKIIELDGGLVI